MFKEPVMRKVVRRGVSVVALVLGRVAPLGF